MHSPPKEAHKKNLQILLQSSTVFLPMGFCFFRFVSKMVPMTSEGADVFTQLCRAANTVTQLNKPPHCLLADRSSASTCSRHNISALQLISDRLKDCSSPPELHLQSQKLHISPFPSAENKTSHLEFENACIYVCMWKTDYNPFF